MRVVAEEWAFLTQRRGDDEARLSLRFCLAAPGEREAHEVAHALRVRSAYDTRVRRSRRGWLRRKTWMVEASLPPCMLSLEDLNTLTGQVESVAEQDGCTLEERNVRWSRGLVPPGPPPSR